MKKAVAVLLVSIMFVFPACNASNKQSGVSYTSSAATSSSNEVRKSGLPIVGQKINLKALVAKYTCVPDWNGHPATEELEKRTNIHIVWDCVPDADFVEKRNLLFASNNLPDFVIRAGLESELEAKYSAAKQIIPLEAMFKDYSPSFSKLMETDITIYNNIKASDGHVYSMPYLSSILGGQINKYWINIKWLSKLSLAMPATTDELYQTLKAFADKDANSNGKKDELGLSGPYKSPNTVYTLLNYFNGSWGFGKNSGIINNYMDIDDNGKTRLFVTDDKFKNELEFFNKLWKEGLMDNESFSQDLSQIVSKATSDLIGFCAYGNNNQFLGKNRNDFVQPPVLKGPYGDNYWVNTKAYVNSNGTFAITSANKYPEATMRWIDYLYSDEGTILIRLGIEGKSYIKNSDGTYALLNNIKNDPTGLTLDQAMGKWALYLGGGIPHNGVDEFDLTAAQLPETRRANETILPSLISLDKIPKLHFSAAESTQLGSYAQDIKTYIDENVIMFITGQRSLSTWDQYVAELNKMNIKGYLAIYQAAYDRWNKE